MTDDRHLAPETLDAYVDGEVSPAEASRVEAHVAECDDCSETLDALMGTIATLRGALPRHAAPDTLQQRVRAAVRADAHGAPAPAMPNATPAAPSAKGPTILRRSWIRAVAAGIAIAVVSAGATLAVTRGDADSRTIEDLEASHVRSLMLSHLVDVPSTDRHQVKPWFAGKIDYAPTIPNVDGAGFPLVGGRLDYVAGRRVAVAAYRRRQHVINLYAWPSSATSREVERQRDGYWFVRWSGDGAEHWAVSDVAIEDLRAFVRVVRAAKP